MIQTFNLKNIRQIPMMERAIINFPVRIFLNCGEFTQYINER
jgi:hypothetical protein